MMTKDEIDLLTRAANPENDLSKKDKRRVLGLCARFCRDVNFDRETMADEAVAGNGPEMWDLPGSRCDG